MDRLFTIVKSVIRSPEELTPETPLLSSGLIDSMSVAELIAALEAEYQTQIDPADLGADNFDTIRQMSDFLNTKR